MFLVLNNFNTNAQTWNWFLPVTNQTYCGNCDGEGRINTDSFGNRYILGSFKDSIIIAGVNLYYPSTSFATANYLIKFDSAGQILWNKIIVSSFGSYFLDMAVSPSGTCYISGDARGVMQIDNVIYNSSQLNPVVCKISANGNCQWIKKFDSDTLFDEGICSAITLDNHENIYACGSWLTDTFPSGEYSGPFLSKLDSAGNEIWLKRYHAQIVNLSCSGCTYFNSISLDDFDHIYLSGALPGDTTAYLLIESDTIFGTGSFISSFDVNGNYRFSKKINIYSIPKLKNLVNGDLVATAVYNDSILIAGTTYYMLGFWDEALLYIDSSGNNYGGMVLGNEPVGSFVSVEIDSGGNLILFGSYNDTVIYDSQQLIPYNSSGGNDMYLLSINPQTNHLNWYYTFGGTSQEIPWDIHLDKSDNIFLTGQFKSDSCDFGPFYDFNLGFTTRFWGEILYPAITTYSNQTVSSCNSYSLNGETYSSSGTYTQTLINAAGGDSILTLNLTINNSTTNSMNENSCGSYTLNGQIYNSTGTYNQILINSVGCDSVITLNLFIETINVSVSNNSPDLIATTSGAIYQWLDCDNNSLIIQGATNQNYTAAANGNYAVAITQNGCTDTSVCYAITGIGLNEIKSINYSADVFPNPASKNLFINLLGFNSEERKMISIKNILGQEIYSIVLTKNLPQEINVSFIEDGIYVVEIKTQSTLLTKKFVKM